MSQQEFQFVVGPSGCHLSSPEEACQKVLSGATIGCCASLGYEVMSLFSFPEEIQWEDSVKSSTNHNLCPPQRFKTSIHSLI